MKEFFRKFIVGLKRNTQIIPLIALMVSCCIFTFTLGAHSVASRQNYTVAMENAIIEAGGSPVSFANRCIGLYVFIITLFSILSVISYLSVHKKGSLSVPMLVIVYVMIAVMILCNILYVNALNFYTSDAFPARKPDDPDIIKAIANSRAHVVSLIISAVFVTVLPLIKKLLNMIDTSVDDEYDKLIDSKTDEEMLIEIDEQA